MSTYIYCRVSTIEQALNGHSLDSQATTCLEYCQRNGLVLGVETNSDRPGVFVDGGKSAYKLPLVQRPGSSAMLKVLKPGDTVVVTSLSRLWRRVVDMATTVERWVEYGISVHFTDYPCLTTTTANGKAMLYIFAAMAQMKSELTSARVKEARLAAKSTAKAKVETVEAKPLPEVKTLSRDIKDVLVSMAKASMNTAVQASGRVLAYVRVSTDDQSVEQQKVCITRRMPVNHWYVDEGVSAFKISLHKRPAGAQMLNDLQPGDTVVIWRPDRMFRSIKDMSIQVDRIHKAGAFLHIVESNIRSDDPFGRMMLAMLSILAEIESQECSRATKHAMLAALATNERARAARLPAMLRVDQTTRHHTHISGITKDERYNLWAQMYLTKKRYGSAKVAARVISNTFLDRVGLPCITGEQGETVSSYIGKLEVRQAAEFSERRQKILEDLTKKPSDSLVLYPINPMSLSRGLRRQAAFFTAMKALPGRYASKAATAAMLHTAVNSEAFKRILALLDLDD